MSKKPPNRPGITFEVGARVEAQDYLQKWYEFVLNIHVKIQNNHCCLRIMLKQEFFNCGPNCGSKGVLEIFREKL